MLETPPVLSAQSIVSALGSGLPDTLAALVAGRSGLTHESVWSDVTTTPMGSVSRIDVSPLEPRYRNFESRNNRLARLALLADDFSASVEEAVARYGRGRIAVVVGTTTAGIREGELAFRARTSREDALAADFSYRHTVDHFSLAAFVKEWLALEGLAYTVSTACSSSSRVLGEAALLLDAGVCDAVVAGGVDTLCEMSIRGFRSLALLSPDGCRPFDVRRAGISLGEAAGFVLIERESSQAAPALPPILLKGVGDSSDAYHMSSPHPDGLGAELAMRMALAGARLAPEQIDYVHLHGTGSRLNDEAEARAVVRVFGGGVHCSSTKGWTGHCLGAAGIVGVVVACLALRNGTLPGNLRGEEPDPGLGLSITLRTRPAPLRNVLTNAFGFGGNNSALVLGTSP
jgi:3-oxoacyl-[acyl-carrier-protein] synthase-1